MSGPDSPRMPPHIRLNSGQEDLLSSNSSTPRPQATRQDSSRSLIPQKPLALRDTPSAQNLYTANAQESAERLLPPSRSRMHRFRDEDLPGSPLQSGFSSRRTSWSSEGGGSRDSRLYGVDDSRAPSRAGSDENDVNTQTVAEKYNILPSAGLLLFPEDVEKDDWLHNPDPNEKEHNECNIWTRRGMVNIGGLAFITLGVLMLFVGYPLLYVLRDPSYPGGIGYHHEC